MVVAEDGVGFFIWPIMVLNCCIFAWMVSLSCTLISCGFVGGAGICDMCVG